MRILKVACLLAALLGAGVAAAERLVTEVITVGYRPVEEIIEIIRPLVPRPGSVSGAYGKLVIRTTPENLRELKEVLATLDKAPTNLLVSVRHSLTSEVQRDLTEVFAEVRSGDVSVSTGRGAGRGRGLAVGVEDGNSSAGVRIDQTRRSSNDDDVQRVRVLEGKEAFIQAGQSVPTTERSVVVTGQGITTINDSVSYQNVTSGFYVRARLNGADRVTVEIFPQRNTLGRAGRIDTQEASTVVSGRLGHWMEIGGVDQSSSSSGSGIGASRRSSSSAGHAIYLKVDALAR